MKISNTTPNYINQTYTGQMNNTANQNLKSQKPADEVTDSINFSNETKLLQKLSKAVETEPADRKKYITDIKQKIEANQYNINADAVAEKVVGSLMDQFG
ncbi:MAG: flagellar biosynthesis anti-sigma factor FlgM [Desulfobacula sp.]|jgi:negative regulator of flagellin synthesis FlgM